MPPDPIPLPGTRVRLSVIVPCFNEQSVLMSFHRRLSAVLAKISLPWEVIYVDDGCRDRTPEILARLAKFPGIRCIHLSRNFGKEAALSAGIDHARGEAVLFMDADLQDPPELIPVMIEHWLAGYDIVNMQRSSRRSDSWPKRKSARAYYALMRHMNRRLHVPTDVSDFRLLGPKPLAALRDMPERGRMLKGLVGWLGYTTIELPYEREAREAGHTKWRYVDLIDLALESIVSFSRKPLRWLTFIATSAFLVSALIFLGALLAGEVTLLHGILTMVSFCALGIAIVGEYVGAALTEVKQRPSYLLAPRSKASPASLSQDARAEEKKWVA